MGSHPTALHDLTGEFTPPGITSLALSKICSDRVAAIVTVISNLLFRFFLDCFSFAQNALYRRLHHLWCFFASLEIAHLSLPIKQIKGRYVLVLESISNFVPIVNYARPLNFVF